MLAGSMYSIPAFADTQVIVQGSQPTQEACNYNVYSRLGDIGATQENRLIQNDTDININGLSVPATKGTSRYNFLLYSLSKIGCPYAWAGEGQAWKGALVAGDGSIVEWSDTNYEYKDCIGKECYDCSGLVMKALKTVGIEVPHFSGSQCSTSYGAVLVNPTSLADLKPGMLLGNAEHVVIYLGNGYVLEAPETGKTVRIISMQDRWGSNAIPADYCCVDYFN